MIDSILNLMFRCAHRRLTRPLTPVSKAGVPHGETYVVCLDCGKQFAYDLKEMRIGHAIEQTHDGSVIPRNLPSSHNTKLKFALGLSVPVAVLIGSVLRAKKPRTQDPRQAGGPSDAERKPLSAQGPAARR
jgi:hypothetical protein